VLEHVTVTRYVTPLREGGSLPAIVEADNLGTYVMKFRGAGQGPLALVAEIIAGELARRLGLRVPELVLAGLDPRIGVSEPDPEIQDLLRASEGLNLGVDFLPGSFGFDPLGWTAEPEFASQVLWFDALAMGEWRLIPVGANRMPAAASYLRRPGDSEYRAFKIDVLRVDRGLIREITTFGATLFRAFGLPPAIR